MVGRIYNDNGDETCIEHGDSVHPNIYGTERLAHSLAAGVRQMILQPIHMQYWESPHQLINQCEFDKSFNILYMHCRIVKTVNRSVNKVAELHDIVCCNEVYILDLTDTWLNFHVKSSELLNGCTIHRRDRNSECDCMRRAGVMI